MASFVLTDAYVSINSVDLSAFVTQVTLNTPIDIHEDTAMGDTFKTRLSGLKDWSMDVDFNQDFASSAVDQTLNTLLGTSTAIEVRPTSSAASATNPKYTGNAIMDTYAPITGNVGDKASVKASFKGNGALTRATS